MKKLFILIAFILIAACGKDRPQDPVVVVQPTPPPVTHAEAAFCQAPGKLLWCGTNQWWHLDCGGDITQEQVYFESSAQCAAKADEKKLDGCVQITWKDGHQDVVHGGFGPCLPCAEQGLTGMALELHNAAVQEYQLYLLMK